MIPDESPLRTQSPIQAATSLVATMLGGGVLSLPYAFSRAGLLLGTILLIAATIFNGVILWVIVYVAKPIKADSYGQMASITSGPALSKLSAILVLLLTTVGAVGYMVLIRDLATPVYLDIVRSDILYDYTAIKVQVCTVLAISPLSYFNRVSSLEFANILCLVSMLILVFVFMYKLIQKDFYHDNSNEFDENIEVKLVSWNIRDALFSFPFFQVAYLCHFNLLSAHSTLKNPTNDRTKIMISGSIFCGFLIYIIIGVSGYLYSFNHVCRQGSPATCVDGVPDDILKAFDEAGKSKFTLIVLARLCLLGTLLLSLPLLVMPARDLLKTFIKDGLNLHEMNNHDENSNINSDDVELNHEGNETAVPLLLDSSLSASSERIKRSIDDIIHVSATSTFILLTLLVAIALPGVGVVFSVGGSAIGFIVGITLPSLFYLNSTSATDLNNKTFTMCIRIMYYGSILLTILCTYQALREAHN